MKNWLALMAIVLSAGTSASEFEGYILPDGFEDFLQSNSHLELPVNFDGAILGAARLLILGEGEYLLTDYNFSSSESTNEELRDVLEKMKKGVSCNTGKCMLDNDLSVEVNENELIIRSAKSAQSSIKANSKILGMSSSDGVTSITDYKYYSSIDEYSEYRSFSLDSNISFQNSYLHIDAAATRSRFDDKLDLRSAEWINDVAGVRTTVGLINLPVTLPSYTNPKYFYGFSMDTNGRSDSSESYITKDITYTSSYQGRVKIYKDEYLLGTYKVMPGVNTIDTSDWPAGSYSIRVVGDENFSIQTYEEAFYKLRLSKEPGLKMFVGVADHQESNAGYLQVDDVETDEQFTFGGEYSRYLGGGFISAISGVFVPEQEYSISYSLSFNRDQLDFNVKPFVSNSSPGDKLEYGALISAGVGVGSWYFNMQYDQSIYESEDIDYKRLSLNSTYSFERYGSVNYSYSTDLSNGAQHNLSWYKYNTDFMNSDISLSLSYVNNQTLYEYDNYYSPQGEVPENELSIILGIDIPFSVFTGESKGSFSISHNSEGGLAVGASAEHSLLNDRLEVGYGASVSGNDHNLEGKIGYTGDTVDVGYEMSFQTDGERSKSARSTRLEGSILTSENDIYLISDKEKGDAAVVLETDSPEDLEQVDWTLSGRRMETNRPSGMSSFSTYQSSVFQSKEGDRLLNVSGGDQKLTVYPGDVITLNIDVDEVREFVSIAEFPDGTPVSQAKVMSDSGISYTDNLGAFSVKVCEDTKKIHFNLMNGSTCSVNIEDIDFSKNGYVVTKNKVLCE